MSSNKAYLKKWRLAFKEKILVNKPIMVIWYPDNPKICPSTIAKYFDSLGATVSQILPEIDLIRRQPDMKQIPKVQLVQKDALLNEVKDNGISVDEYENILGAAALGLSE